MRAAIIVIIVSLNLNSAFDFEGSDARLLGEAVVSAAIRRYLCLGRFSGIFFCVLCFFSFFIQNWLVVLNSGVTIKAASENSERVSLKF